MNNNHFIDAFYRTYENVNENTQARTPDEPGIKLVDDKWDAQSKRLVNVNPGVGIGEAVTTEQAMIRSDDSFKVGAKKYEFMEANRNVWDGKKRKISDLSTGEADSDAATVGQIMRGDKGSWNAKKMKISNVVAGTAKDDVAVYGQIPKESLQLKDDKWNGNNKVIANVSKGSKPNDVAIMSQIPKDCLQLKDSKWSGGNKVISNVAMGTNPNDVAVYGQIPKDCLQLKNSKWDGKNKIIVNVAKGSKPNDVATMGQISKDNLQLKDDKWNGNNKIIENVAQGTKPNDVAVMSQIPKDYLQSKDGKWNGDNKKITSVGQGTEDNDVAIVRQLPTDYMKSVNSSWDAGNRKITNVKEGTQPNDVLTFNQALKPSINKGEFYTTSDTTYKFMQPVTYKLHGEQLPTGVIVSKRDVWDAQSMPIRDIAPGYYETDACRVDQALVCNYPGGEYYDAIGKQICNIRPGTKYGDALVFEQFLRIENNELYVGNTKLELYFIESNGDQVRVRIQSKEQ